MSPECKGAPSFSTHEGSEQPFLLFCLLSQQRQRTWGIPSIFCHWAWGQFPSPRVVWVFNPMGGFLPELEAPPVSPPLGSQESSQRGVGGLRQPCGPPQLGQCPSHWEGKDKGGVGVGAGKARMDGGQATVVGCSEAGFLAHRQERDMWKALETFRGGSNLVPKAGWRACCQYLQVPRPRPGGAAGY